MTGPLQPPTTIYVMAKNIRPIYRQVYDNLRHAILTGQLAVGKKLPSSRALAGELGVSRNTVLNAFQQLLAEGFVEGKVGRGTFVANNLPGTRRAESKNTSPNGAAASVQISNRGQRLAASRNMPRLPRLSGELTDYAFRVGVPAFEEFPHKVWEHLLARRWRRSGRGLMDYQGVAGYGPLREAIAAYLGTSRGVHCTASEVIIVAGSQQGLDLLARVLLDPGDHAWVEDPGYLGARNALAVAGARLTPVPVDAEGLNVEAGIARQANARLAVVTPSYQFPLGHTLTLSRRLALLDWASRSGAWIIEDDYYSEYRYGSRPLTALRALDQDGRVLYMGSFSKVLFPALRLGYLVVPPALAGAISAARGAMTIHPAALEQAVLTDFILEGHYGRHLRRMRRLYAERQEALLQAIGRAMPDRLKVRPAQAGMHVVGWLPNGASDQAASQLAAGHGVATLPLSAFRIETSHRGGLLLGYAAVHPDRMTHAVARLAAALEELPVS